MGVIRVLGSAVCRAQPPLMHTTLFPSQHHFTAGLFASINTLPVSVTFRRMVCKLLSLISSGHTETHRPIPTCMAASGFGARFSYCSLFAPLGVSHFGAILRRKLMCEKRSVWFLLLWIHPINSMYCADVLVRSYKYHFLSHFFMSYILAWWITRGCGDTARDDRGSSPRGECLDLIGRVCVRSWFCTECVLRTAPRVGLWIHPQVHHYRIWMYDWLWLIVWYKYLNLLEDRLNTTLI
jgi:hypothetical protein